MRSLTSRSCVVITQIITPTGNVNLTRNTIAFSFTALLVACIAPSSDDNQFNTAHLAASGTDPTVVDFDKLLQKGIAVSLDTLTTDTGRPRFRFGLFGTSNPAGKPHFDSDYFRLDLWVFKLQPGVSASQALDAFFADAESYRMECATAISVVHYAAVRYAFRELTGSDKLFDQRFADMAIGRLSQGTENDIKEARITVPTNQMRVGDHAYFHNPGAPPDAVAGGWNGENVIILGEDRYFGHPFGITTAQVIIDSLNSVKPADAPTAYLDGPVYRLDAAPLFRTVQDYLAAGGDGDTCEDVAPSPDHTCAEQAAWGKCDEPWMTGFCDAACGRCDEPVCQDTPAPGEYTCAQQAAWGKCDEPWMAGYCDVTCGRCSIGGDEEPPVCTDVAPSDDHTCAEQVAWGKCDQAWMAGFCDASCGRCTAPGAEIVESGAGAAQSTL